MFGGPCSHVQMGGLWSQPLGKRGDSSLCIFAADHTRTVPLTQRHQFLIAFVLTNVPAAQVFFPELAQCCYPLPMLMPAPPAPPLGGT